VINNQRDLDALGSRLEKVEWLTIDTEADSLHSYPEKLCLLQISIPGEDLLLDTLAGLNFAPVLEALKKKEIILHGADYDLRLLYRTYRFVPQRIFDTMWAARFLGLAEFGLGSLVHRFAGVTLEKGPQKMDWSRRPLSPRMENYARNDTHYLKLLSDILRAELKEKNRLSWLQETGDRLIAESIEQKAPDPDVVWRIRGSDRLNPFALAVLRELWNWREQEALESNKPPYFIMSHERLLSMANSVVRGKSIAAIIPRRLSARRRKRLITALEKGLNLPESEHPAVLRQTGRRPLPQEQKQFEELKARRDAQASQLGIDPSLIASRSTLASLARDRDGNAAELMNWQKELLSL
jgi:ribonuclease D